MAAEPRTVRDARLELRRIEAELEQLMMAPAMSLAGATASYVRQARLRLRCAEREAYRYDDPRVEPLPRLRAQLSAQRRVRRVDRNGDPLPRRQRHRCPSCFDEILLHEHDLPYACSRCAVAYEPVARRPRST